MSFKDFAVNLSLEAGKQIKDGFFSGVQREWKADETPVTTVDKAVNSLVIKKIKETYPDHALLGEEESNLIESDYVWVCDPIDGTIPFSHGYPICVFTLALTIKGEVILATIYDPFTDRLVVAEKGKGTYLNDKKLTVSESTALKSTVIELAVWTTAPYNLQSLYNELLLKGCQVTTIRSTVYAGMLVALGQFAGVLFAGKTAWDAAAVKLIVEEAGGLVTDLKGNDQPYNKDIHGFIASNGKIHDQLLEIVKTINVLERN